MAPVLVATTGCQADAYFNNDTIPPGVRRPRLPWAYTYAQFEALLLAYPTVHREDFVTFGVLQAQPQRGSHCEWGEVAGVLAHMAGGRRLLANSFFTVMRRKQRLARDDPMRAVEEEALVALVLDERRRSNAPLGDGATLGAPGGPLALAAPRRRTRRPPTSSSTPPSHRPTSPQQEPSRGRDRRPYRPHLGPVGHKVALGARPRNSWISQRTRPWIRQQHRPHTSPAGTRLTCRQTRRTDTWVLTTTLATAAQTTGRYKCRPAAYTFTAESTGQ